MRRLLLTEQAGKDQELLRTLRQLYDVRCANTHELMQELLAFRPELMVIDLSDADRECSGVLRLARAMGVCPRTLALSCGSSDAMMQLLADGTVTFMLVSPFETRDLIHRLREMELLLCKSRTDRLNTLTAGILQELGMKADTTGFRCLCKGAVYLYYHENCLITDELYPYVAKCCGGTVSSVEKAISRCIEYGWSNGNPLVWQYYFGTFSHLPSNAKFLKALIQVLKNHY